MYRGEAVDESELENEEEARPLQVAYYTSRTRDFRLRRARNGRLPGWMTMKRKTAAGGRGGEF